MPDTIFHFLLRKVFETYQIYYTILLIAFECVLILKHILCLPQDYFFRLLAYKSCLSRFSVLKIILGFPGSRFFRVQVQGLGPCFRSSPTLLHFRTLKNKKCENKSKVHEVHKIHHYTIIKWTLKQFLKHDRV